MAATKIQLTTIIVGFVSAFGGASISFMVPVFWSRISKKCVTKKECTECSVRRDVSVIKKLSGELAIKAGVPPQEVMKLLVDGDEVRG